MHPAGTLNYRYELQAYSVASTSASGEPTLTWSTIATLWGGRKMDQVVDEAGRAQTLIGQITELIPLRFRAGILPERRFLRWRDKTTLAAGINASVATVTLAAVLKLDGGNIDFIKIDNEIMRVTAGATTTTLTVERGQQGTTAASHSINSTIRRVEVLEIVAVERADEREGEMLVRVKRNG